METSSAGLRHTPMAFSPVAPEKETFIPAPVQQLNPVKNIIFRLVNRSRGDVYLPLYAQNVINPKTQKLDTLRVLKGVYTIWESEQKDLKMDAKTLSKSRRSLKFEFSGKDNIAIVPADDNITLEALRIIPHNMEVPGANKGSRFAFFEINTEKQAEIDAAKRQLRRKAVRIAEEQPLDKLKEHAVFLNDRRLRVFDDYGYPKVEKALRNEYEDYADLNPEKFLNTVNSPEVKIGALIMKAISEAKIDVSTVKGVANWANGGFICRVPTGKPPFDYLLEFAMLPGDESKAFKERLEIT